jgi:iron complex outermembrane receptor protein
MTREEVEEKLLMTPGDITMLLNETSGLRVQSTSPALGGASVRVLGLRGRYTQVLVDGLPLHGAQAGGFTLLQIPPMDLASVEVVKGVSSALYGGSALGGVVNLISRRPDDGRAQNELFNATSRGGLDAVYFVADTTRGGHGISLLAGFHRQRSADLDGDEWLDLPEYRRVVLRPRLFTRTAGGGSRMFTVGVTSDRRRGGFKDLVGPDGPWFEELTSQRQDLGATIVQPIGMTFLALKGAHSVDSHTHTFGVLADRDTHRSTFGEASLTGAGLGGIWVLGAAVQHNAFSERYVGAFSQTETTPGVFAQHTFDLGVRTAITASARADLHSEQGTQFAPRLSVLRQLGSGWTLRASGGGGYYAPTPFVEEVEAVGLRPLDPPSGLRVERATSSSLDLGGALLGVEVLATLFASAIHDAVAARMSPSDSSRVELVNLSGPTRTHGAELLLRARPDPFHLSFSLAYLTATEPDPVTGLRGESPLTPKLTFGLVGAWESEDVGRVGIEVYYTGPQSTPDIPLGPRSPAFTHVGVLAERRAGRARIFINGENLLDVRQTKHAPILRTSPGLGGRRTTDIWGPLEGRVVNVGVRF